MLESISFLRVHPLRLLSALSLPTLIACRLAWAKLPSFPAASLPKVSCGCGEYPG